MGQGDCAVMLQAGRRPGSSYACGRPSAGSCIECSGEICQLHAEECDRCHKLLCSSCYEPHVGKAHAKAVQSARDNSKARRSA
jgi:hypothetical protein